MVFPIPESVPYEVDSAVWGRQLNPSSVELTETQVNADITMWMINSQYRQYKGQRLWEEFQEWYEGWTDATFKIAHREALKLVRIQLILHGFQVRQTRGSNSYAKVLVELISKDKSDERTKEVQEEADRLKEEYTDMYEIIAPKKSIKIQASPTPDSFEQLQQDEQQRRIQSFSLFPQRNNFLSRFAPYIWSENWMEQLRRSYQMSEEDFRLRIPLKVERNLREDVKAMREWQPEGWDWDRKFKPTFLKEYLSDDVYQKMYSRDYIRRLAKKYKQKGEENADGLARFTRQYNQIAQRLVRDKASTKSDVTETYLKNIPKRAARNCIADTKVDLKKPSTMN
ncbi:hypothetical protein ACHAPG_004917 [Botrytis cinerea]